MAPLILLLVLLWAIPAAPADRLVTLEARDTPLIEVLKQLSTQTGYAFILDITWSGLIVSTVLKDSPLHAGLRQILGRLNHALIYLPDNRIRLIIMEPSPSGPGAGPGNAVQARGRDRRPPPVAAPAPALPPEPEPIAAAEESAQAQEESQGSRPAAN
jgi:hypothetical protein